MPWDLAVFLDQVDPLESEVKLVPVALSVLLVLLVNEVPLVVVVFLELTDLLVPKVILSNFYLMAMT